MATIEKKQGPNQRLSQSKNHYPIHHKTTVLIAPMGNLGNLPMNFPIGEIGIIILIWILALRLIVILDQYLIVIILMIVLLFSKKLKKHFWENQLIFHRQMIILFYSKWINMMEVILKFISWGSSWLIWKQGK